MFQKISIKINVFVLLGLLAWGSCFQSARAQSQAQGVTISPPLLELTLNPGAEIEETILVSNPAENLSELYPSTANFEAAGEGGEPTFLSPADESGKFSLARWISYTQTKVALVPRQQVEFKYKITVPPDAEPGGHYGVVFLATQPPETEADVSQVAIAGKIGSLILVRVPGDIREEARVEEFSGPWMNFKTPISFLTFIRNLGNIHFKPDGEISIRNWRGKEIERIPLNPKKGNILPESRRRFDSVWSPSTTPFWKTPFGRFSANLRIVYGASQKTLDGKIYFWLIPYWLIVAVAFLIIIAIIYFYRRRRKKKKGQNAPPPTGPDHPEMEIKKAPPLPAEHLPPFRGNQVGRIRRV